MCKRIIFNLIIIKNRGKWERGRRSWEAGRGGGPAEISMKMSIYIYIYEQYFYFCTTFVDRPLRIAPNLGML